ncbi:hypothetical protein FEP99_04574 [Burkholderia pseudomultivorans]|nr:hypothetical protein [Burkholderia pseudomultivorans]
MRDVAATDRLHRLRQARLVARRHEQLHLTRQQHVSVHRKMVIARGGLQAVDEEFVVLVVNERGLLIQAAQYHVLRLVGNVESC